ncbi:MAG TPA: hypothetical protein VFY93_05305 [Planctomycetota bacterium]|nr:hypothetical protein [Planctomycetota bacterium]
MAQAKGKGGGVGSALGCLVVLGVIGFVVWHFYPQISSYIGTRSPPVGWGEAYMGGGLRVKVEGAEIEMTQVDDVLGQRDGTLDLHVTLEITNLSDTAIKYREPQLLRASEPKLTDDRGRGVGLVAYGDKATVEGQLENGQEIEPHDSETHDLLFKVPPADAQSFLLNVDMAMFGGSGVAQFRIPADKIKGR